MPPAKLRGRGKPKKVVSRPVAAPTVDDLEFNETLRVERVKAGKRALEDGGKFTVHYCPECGQSDSVLFVHGRRSMCRMCWIHESRRLDKLVLGELLPMLRDRCICAYCGEFALEIEHVTPRRAGLPTWTVPACHECNALAGGKLFYTFAEKRDAIHELIRRKYRKVLATAEYDREELREMGRGLRNLLRSALDAKGIILQRLAFQLEVSRTNRFPGVGHE